MTQGTLGSIPRANSAEWEAFCDALAIGAGVLFAIVGLIWLLAGHDDAIRFHGGVLALGATIGIAYVFRHIDDATDHNNYMDGPIRFTTIAAIFWGIAGFTVGDILAWQLAVPALNLDLPWTSFGRLRPLHTSAVIFAFGGNVLNVLL